MSRAQNWSIIRKSQRHEQTRQQFKQYIGRYEQSNTKIHTRGVTIELQRTVYPELVHIKAMQTGTNKQNHCNIFLGGNNHKHAKYTN